MALTPELKLQAKALDGKISLLTKVLEDFINNARTADRGVVSEALKSFVESQVEKKKNVVHREEDSLKRNKRQLALTQQKLSRLNKELARFEGLTETFKPTTIEDVKQRIYAVNLAKSVRSSLLEGKQVLEAEVNIRTILKTSSGSVAARLSPLKSHQNQYPAYYSQENELAAVPLNTISRSLDELESLTIARTLKGAALLLNHELADIGMSTRRRIDGNKVFIQVGTSIELDTEQYSEDQQREMLNVFRNFTRSERARALLEKLEKAGKKVVIKQGVGDKPDYSSGSMLDEEDPRRESLSEKIDRKQRQYSLNKQIRALNPTVVDGYYDLKNRIENASNEADRAQKNLTQAEENLERTQENNESDPEKTPLDKVRAAEGALQRATSEHKRKTQFLQILKNDLSLFLTRHNLTDEQAEDRYTSLSNLRSQQTSLSHAGVSRSARDSTVTITLGGKSTEFRSKFNYAGVSDVLPLDIILFHELTHSLHTATGQSKTHLSDDRWLNLEEKQTIESETLYLEEMGYKWKRTGYDAKMSPVDAEGTEISEGRTNELKEKFRLRRAGKNQMLSEESDSSESSSNEDELIDRLLDLINDMLDTPDAVETDEIEAALGSVEDWLKQESSPEALGDFREQLVAELERRKQVVEE